MMKVKAFFHFNRIDDKIEVEIGLKADFHSVQFSKRADFCDIYRFLLKCVLSCRMNFIRHG